MKEHQFITLKNHLKGIHEQLVDLNNMFADFLKQYHNYEGKK